MHDLLEEYEQNGYIILRSNFSEKQCKELKEYFKVLSPKVTIPHTDIPWGWGNLVNDQKLKFIVDDKNINSFLTNLFGNYVYNHLYVHNKVSWYGLLENWHQEVYNIKTFAPGYDNSDWACFAQIYVPLDPQDLENGGLKIIPGSHKLGQLDHIDFMGPNLGHKRITKRSEIERAYQKCGIINPALNPGDVVIFSHLLLHGSTSNNSPFDRQAVVLQARKPIKEKDDVEFEIEAKYRSDYVTKILTEELEKQEAKRALYKDSHVKVKK